MATESIGAWDTLSMYVGGDGYVSKRNTEKVESFRKRIEGIQKVASRAGMCSGEGLSLILAVYGWFWDEIPYGAFVEIEEFLLLNTDFYRIIDPWYHEICLKHKDMSEYRELHQRAADARKSSLCDWSWYRDSRERIERYGPKHGRRIRSEAYSGYKDRKYMQHYLREAAGVETEKSA